MCYAIGGGRRRTSGGGRWRHGGGQQRHRDNVTSCKRSCFAERGVIGALTIIASMATLMMWRQRGSIQGANAHPISKEILRLSTPNETCHGEAVDDGGNNFRLVSTTSKQCVRVLYTTAAMTLY